MKLETTFDSQIGPHRYRRQRRRPLVGPTGVPDLDTALAMHTKPYRWFRRKSANPVKQVSFRDDAIISMSVAGEVTDTSIVEVGRSRPQFQYTRETLMNLKNLPLSKRRPECLNIVYNNSRGVWDPERWHLDRKRSETPPDEERQGREQIVDNHAHKRRSGDPRERIRKEQDGIVLSPQRRSFNSGCFVNVTNKRPESPVGKTEVPHREPVRRIGSGRILARDMWDFRSENEKIESERSEYNFRSGIGGGGPLRDRDIRDNREAVRERDRDRDRENVRDREERNEERRYERRSFGRDFGERDRDRGLDRNEREKERGRRFSIDRRNRTYNENRETEEPEWFSSGPTSQLDTIELRGFEDTLDEKVVTNPRGKKASPAQKKRGKKYVLVQDGKVVTTAVTTTLTDTPTTTEIIAGPKGRSTPTSMDQPMYIAIAPHSPISEQPEPVSTRLKEKMIGTKKSTEQSSEAKSRSVHCHESSPSSFNLDDFLKSDVFPGVPGLLTNGVGSNGGASSRFSQWFKRESPDKQLDSRRASIQDELLNNLLNDISEPNIQIPSVTESSTYFAPISPANTTCTAAASTGVKLLEMLHRSNKPNQNGQGDGAAAPLPAMQNIATVDLNRVIGSKKMETSGKVVNLEELEARMRGAPAMSASEPPKDNRTEEDLAAFKKLLAQVTGGQAIPATNGPIPQRQQSVTLLQLLNNQLKSHAQISPQPLQQQHHQNIKQMHPTAYNHVGSLGSVPQSNQSHLQHENLMKVLHVQQQQQKQRQQSEMLSMMMGGQQRILGVSPIPPEVQMMVNSAPSIREFLQRPEAEAIIRGLQQGEITRHHLVQQLQNPALQHRHREVLVNILKVYGNTTPRTISPHPNVPTQQDHLLQQMLYQQQNQQRIPSPMSNAIPHRVPSPREIAMHTQSIIQNALIKKKLEEQRENFRKRQEQQPQAQQRCHSPVIQSTKQTPSPTPLAFTPTSVLRKMTAEKETEGNNDPSKLASPAQAPHLQMQSNVQILAQGILSRHSNIRSQSVQVSWPDPFVKQHPGRPIVKGMGTNQFAYSVNVDYHQQPTTQQLQQERLNSGMYGNNARSKHTLVTPTSHSQFNQYNATQNTVINRRGRINVIDPMNNQMKGQQEHSHHVTMQQQQRSVNSQAQLSLNEHFNSSRSDGGRAMHSQQIGIGVGRHTSSAISGFLGETGGDLSPTSNQLARWFSPELLAQARAGKLPELGPTKVLSLEELERLQQASTTVHN